MAQSRKSDPSRRGRPAAMPGVTLLEVALSMAVFAVLGLAVCHLMLAGVNTQLSYRIGEYQHAIAMNVVDQLRMDLRMASQIAITGGGNTLTFRTFDPNVNNEVQVTYRFAGGTLTRTTPRNTYNFTTGYVPQMGIACGAGTQCFQGVNQGAGTPVKRVTLNNLEVIDQSVGNSQLDREFGKSRYRINEVSFDVMEGSQFQ